jgi:hypothetical protein
LSDKAAYKHEWYIKNRERILADREKLRATEGYAEYQHKVWERRKADPIRLAKKYSSNVSAARQSRAEILSKLGSVCQKCGFNDPRALQIDHVNGGGQEHRDRVGRGNRNYYRSILRDPELDTKFQILCANCNWIKRYENQEVQLREVP